MREKTGISRGLYLEGYVGGIRAVFVLKVEPPTGGRGELITYMNLSSKDIYRQYEYNLIEQLFLRIDTPGAVKMAEEIVKSEEARRIDYLRELH